MTFNKNNLTERYWIPFNKYLNIILQIISVNNNDDMFNNYFYFTIPSLSYRRIEWTEINKQESLKLCQMITKIQTNINKKQNNSKLIVKLFGLNLMKDHINFLKFWFNNDNDLFSFFNDNHCGIPFKILKFIAM